MENLVLCIGDRDITVIPRESGQFGFYADDSDEIILKMEETELYMNNQDQFYSYFINNEPLLLISIGG